MTAKRLGFLVACALGILVVRGAGPGSRGRRAPEASRPAPDRPGDPSPSGRRAPHDPGLIGETIAFWKQQAARDPQGAIERRELAGAYLARHRETGDIADAVAAEESARQSLRILPRNNSDALARLGRSLLAQHRFPEAMEAARRAEAYDPMARRLVADVAIELGDYDDAGRALDGSPPGADDPNYHALKARLESIDGRPEAALRLLRTARQLASDRVDLPAEAVAWYHVTLAHALIESGRLDEGERACRDALEVFPRDYRAMTAMAGAAAWRGDWRGAIAWATRAVAASPQDFTALRLLADAHAALGQDEEAERHRRRLEALAHSFPRIHDRNWAMFCADNGRDLDEALALARADLQLRHDIHAHDTLAWVCFQKGMLTEAESAMQRALARGTREAALFYHAGMIARASGDPGRARDHFARARDINPHAIPLRWLRWIDPGPDEARR
jgi:tetratricopeptide (TPR) repeat protein